MAEDHEPTLGLVLILVFLFLVLVSGCANPQGPQATDPFAAIHRSSASIDVIVENQNWDARNLRLFCDGTLLDRLSGLEMTQNVQERIDVHGCRSLSFDVTSIGGTVLHQSYRPIPISPDTELVIVIESSIHLTNWRLREE